MDHNSNNDLNQKVIALLNLVNPHIWVMIISLWGGIIGYFSRIYSGAIEHFDFIQFILELTSSAFCGLLVFYFCLGLGINEILMTALVGIAGHMGNSLLAEIERFLIRLFKRRFR